MTVRGLKYQTDILDHYLKTVSHGSKLHGAELHLSSLTMFEREINMWLDAKQIYNIETKGEDRMCQGRQKTAIPRKWDIRTYWDTDLKFSWYLLNRSSQCCHPVTALSQKVQGSFHCSLTKVKQLNSKRILSFQVSPMSVRKKRREPMPVWKIENLGRCDIQIKRTLEKQASWVMRNKDTWLFKSNTLSCSCCPEGWLLGTRESGERPGQSPC